MFFEKRSKTNISLPVWRGRRKHAHRTVGGRELGKERERGDEEGGRKREGEVREGGREINLKEENHQ